MKNCIGVLVALILAVSLQADWRNSSANEAPTGLDNTNSFGQSVSLGNEYKVVGAPDENAFYVYRKNGDDWIQIFKEDNQYIGCSLPGGCKIGKLGYSVSLAESFHPNANPHLLVVGAPYSFNPGTPLLTGVYRGAFCTYAISEDTVSQIGTCTIGDAKGNLGYSVDISNYSYTILIGKPPHANIKTISDAKLVVGNPRKKVNSYIHQGEVEFYDFNGTVWKDKTTATVQEDEADAQFGSSVAIYKARVVIGAPNANANDGLVFVHKSDGSWEETITSIDGFFGIDIEKFGKSVDIYNEYIIVSKNILTSVPPQGGATMFKYNSGWNLHTFFELGRVDDLADGFGKSVSISANYVAVGAPTNTYTKDSADFQGGGVFIYDKNETGAWNFTTELNGEDGSLFGQSVSLYEDKLMVGEPGSQEVSNHEYYEKVKASPAIIMYLLN